MSKSLKAVTILAIICLLTACGPRTTPTPVPINTETAIPMLTRIPTHTTTSNATPMTGNPSTPTSMPSPTPQPGWKTYTNNFLGYSFHYPEQGIIREVGFQGMVSDEVPPPGFGFNDYFDYVASILPKNICVIVTVPGVLISIEPPWSISSYAQPCVGLGVGDQYDIKPGNMKFTVNGQEYTSKNGNKLYLKSTGAFRSEIYFIDLENGFRVTVVGGPADSITSQEYQSRWEGGLEILASLHWDHTPNLTRPGTTCAGKNTLFMPGTEAIVMDAGTAGTVYSKADFSSESIAELPTGVLVLVREGPVCTNNGILWRVESSLIPGGSGWMAEKSGSEYLLTATTVLERTNCAADWTRLKAEDYASVSEGEPNRVRSGPSRNAPVIAQIYPGAIVRIIEGPICADEMVFWKVENATIPGGAGWTAEGNRTDYWLEPYEP